MGMAVGTTVLIDPDEAAPQVIELRACSLTE